MNPGQFTNLLSALLDGSISDQQHHLLEEELLRSSEARSLYLALLDNEAALEWEFEKHNGNDRVLGCDASG